MLLLTNAAIGLLEFYAFVLDVRHCGFAYGVGVEADIE